jgi:hypothetical protein
MSDLFWRRAAAILSALAFVAAATFESRCHGAGYVFTTIADNQNGITFDTLGRGFRQLSNSGEVAFQGSTMLQNFVFKGSGGALTTIAGPPTFFGLNSGFGNGAIRDDGSVVFRGTPNTSGAVIDGVYAGSGGGATPLYTEEIDPNTDHPELAPRAASTSPSGITAFLGLRYDYPDQDPGESTSGFYMITGGGLVTLAEEGGGAAPANLPPVINDAGQAALVMRTGVSASTIYRYDNGSLTTIATGFSGGDEIWMNAGGDVIFADALAVKMYHNGVTTTVASTVHGFSNLMKPGNSDVYINDSGQVAFWGGVAEVNGNPVNLSGIYRGPDITSDRVVVYGDSVLGHVVNATELLGLNNSGQMLFSVEAQSPDDWRALVVATPAQAADFQEDGDVDAGDLDRWKMHHGTSPSAAHSQGDADGDGDVDGGDFLVWQRQLGSGTSVAPSGAVPEPASTAMAIAIVCTVGWRERARRGECSRRRRARLVPGSPRIDFIRERRPRAAMRSRG